MAVKAAMSWVPSQARWMKQYRNKQYAVGCKALGCPATKEGSIHEANAWWKRKQAELDGLVRFVDIIHQEHISLPTEFDGIQKEHPGLNEDQAMGVLIGRRETAAKRKQDAGGNIGDYVKQSIDHKKTLAEGGRLSVGAYDLYRRCMDRFEQFAGKEFIDQNWSDLLLRYHAHLLQQVDNNAINEGYAASHITAMKDFIWYLVDRETIQIPRILVSGRKGGSQLRIKGKGKPKRAKRELNKNKSWVGDLDGLKAMIWAAPEKTRLYILLALNCGYLTTDIAELGVDEVNWQDGKIENRERCKTAGSANTPEVTYHLWPETFRLLKKFRSPNGPKNRYGNPVCLVSKSGRKLLETKIKEDGKPSRVDGVKSAYRSFTRRPTINVKQPLQVLRHTMATLITAECDNDETLAQYFLGHSNKSTARRHYILGGEEKLASVLKIIGQTFGL